MSIAPPKAILFDWDNTLVDTWPIIHDALEYTFVEMGQQPWTFEQTKARVKKSMRDSFPEVFGEGWEKAGKIYQDRYQHIHLARLEALPGAEALLKWLRRHHVYVAIVSNKKGPTLRKEVAELGWENYFDKMVGAQDAARDKPFPDPVLFALEGSGLHAGEHVWLIGDSVIDLECTKNAGIGAVFYGDVVVKGNAELEAFTMHHHARDHEALLSFLKSVLGP